ncbi:DNA/RNA helicase domain-containing protein [Thermocoleostomius sinensis]|uniref:DUF2075 domain-containing protein n=1 Tax=Thermocoleostomius sinensis A174 TaxID=2016057 RepID=A0A9E8ZFY6_9CYAN|nr:DNA/RNA helicase domain-containing protein [Thermocoleostomius sinensis]WAL62695.1 DUF2075 domain-containing protein [Thermocoleostomius sinensis A174]
MPPVNQLSFFQPDPQQPTSVAEFAPYGWQGSIVQFLQLLPTDWLDKISSAYQRLYRQRPTATQRQAWLDSAEILQSQLTQFVETRSAAANWTLIFEYELPREGGRRPDLILLAVDQILVIEFKQKRSPSTADLDQVAAYARDLAEYHSASAHHHISAILIPTQCTASSRWQDEVLILNPNDIANYLSQLAANTASIAPINPDAWLSAEYQPLPTIVQAARHIFQHEPLPDIKRARSAGIPDLIAYLNRLVETAAQHHERHLVLITGVPGAGKTLVGLQFVYQAHLQSGDRQAVFLSGNAPLVAVLQYALKSRVFVQAARNFYIDHEVRQRKAPREHLIVFDEAQRAWDAERMAEKYGIQSAAAGTVLSIAERSPNWGVVVGLIGEGQQIHVGEEDGIEQWNQGLMQVQSEWHVHCPPEPAHHFTAVSPDRLHAEPMFNLTTSLRSHLASDVQTWVAHLLSGNFEAATQLMPSLISSGFDAYLTRDLEAAKTYCRDRYVTQSNKRYGLLASSRAHNLSQYGIANDYKATQRVKVGPWYIDPPDSPLSCCAFADVVTEFGCQGLELDLPIIGWGNDLRWQESTWVTTSRQRQVRDPLRLRLNSYRVLLTRGRDGFIVFIPPDANMNQTYEVVRSAGLRLLG